MEERDFSKAREELRRKEEQAQGAILELLKKLDERTDEVEAEDSSSSAPIDGAEKNQPRPRRRDEGPGDGEVRRNRRMGKFVEHLPMESKSWQMEVDVSKEDKADWRLSRTGPKILSYEPAPWEEESTAMERDSSQQSEDEKKEWRLSSIGPKLVICEPAPWEETEPITPITPITPLVRSPSQGLEDIIEDEEDGAESPSTQYVIPKDLSSNILTPPTDYANPSSPAGYFPIYKFPSDAIPAPRSPRPSTSTTRTEFDYIPKTPPKSPTNLRTRAGFKKIFLSSLRPKRRDENEPLSPSFSISSTATTPSLPTPTIRITSPFHPRRLDGSPIDGDDVQMGNTSPVETGYRLPELRLSRADWGEWGRQIADRL